MNPKIKTQLILPFVLLALLAAAGAALFWNQERMPDWGSMTTVDGQKLTAEALQGKVVMVNFWATSCSSCVAEMPQLKQLYQDYHAKGFELLALAMPYDQTALVERFQKAEAINFPVVHDAQGTLIPQFGRVTVTPTTLLYSKSGVKKYAWIGPMEDKKLRATLDGLLTH